MKANYMMALMAALAISTNALAASDGEAVFNKSKCSTCHKLDNKTVGPTLKDIAAKYAGDKDAAAKLEKKVRSGGSGVWGSVPMPRTPSSVSDEEIKTAVAWVLSHK